MKKEVNETLSKYIERIENVDLKSRDGIILSRDIKIPYLLDGEADDIIKTPIAWPLLDYKMFYIVSTKPGLKVEPHSHDESIFRLLIEGDLVVNGISIEVGEWFLVEAGTTYSIESKNGYTAMSAYTSICQTRRYNSVMHIEIDKF
jgi:hypothetical protein